MALVRSKGENDEVGTQRGDIRHTLRTGKGYAKGAVYSHVRIRQCAECLLKPPARGFGKDMAADMAIAHMYNTYRIGSDAQTEHAQLLPKGFQNADTVYQLVPAQLPKGCGQDDERNGQGIRTLSADHKRVAIKRRFLKPGTTRKRILGTGSPQRQKKQSQHHAANSKS